MSGLPAAQAQLLHSVFRKVVSDSTPHVEDHFGAGPQLEGLGSHVLYESVKESDIVVFLYNTGHVEKGE